MQQKWWKKIDKPLILVYMLLVAMGWFNIYSAVYSSESLSVFSFDERYGRQLVFIGVAMILAVVILILDSRVFVHFTNFYYFIGISLLILVLVIGTEISGAKAWIRLGPISVQPAELAKFATCLAFAKYVTRPNYNYKRISNQLKSTLFFILPIFLIMLQPDAGSALVFMSFMLVMYREGMSGRVLIAGLVCIFLFIMALLVNIYILLACFALISIILIIYNKKTFKNIVFSIFLSVFATAFVFGVGFAFEQLSPHQQTRINVLIGTESDIRGAGYNVNQSKIAIGSGGFSGKGYLEGTQTKFNFVPEQSTDFIFCTIGEEWGFVGTTTVLALFLFMLLRIIKLAERQRSNMARVYGYGVACIIFVHLLINIGMTIGLVPVIGIPLPFFSYGGSSLWSFTLLLFVFIKMDANRYI